MQKLSLITGLVMLSFAWSFKILFREMGLFCLLGIACFVPAEAKFFEGVIFLPYNKSFIDQGCKVKMAGYWPRYFFCFIFMDLNRKIKCNKRTWLQWNLDLMKSLGTVQICSLNGRFVISRFFSIHFTVTLVVT